MRRSSNDSLLVRTLKVLLAELVRKCPLQLKAFAALFVGAEVINIFTALLMFIGYMVYETIVYDAFEIIEFFYFSALWIVYSSMFVAAAATLIVVVVHCSSEPEEVRPFRLRGLVWVGWWMMYPTIIGVTHLFSTGLIEAERRSRRRQHRLADYGRFVPSSVPFVALVMPQSRRLRLRLVATSQRVGSILTLRRAA